MKNRFNKSKIYGIVTLILVVAIGGGIVQSLVANRQRNNLVQKVQNEMRLSGDDQKNIGNILLTYENDFKNLNRPILNFNLMGTRAQSQENALCEALLEALLYPGEFQDWLNDAGFNFEIEESTNYLLRWLDAANCAL